MHNKGKPCHLGKRNIRESVLFAVFYNLTRGQSVGFCKKLAKVFDGHVAKLALDDNDLELNLIDLNNISDADLGCLAVECGLKGGRGNTVLCDDFGVEVNFAGK